MSRAPIRWAAVGLLALALPACGRAAATRDRRLDPRQISSARLPDPARRAGGGGAPGGGARATGRRRPRSAPSAGAAASSSTPTRATLLTVSYVLLDAARIEVSLRDGRKVPARLVGLDLEVGVGVAQLDGPRAVAGRDPRRLHDGRGRRRPPARWACRTTAATSWPPRGPRPGGAAVRGRVGVHAGPRLHRDARTMPAFGGAALVNAAGSVIGITSLRLGEAPHVNLAIPDREVPRRQGRAAGAGPRDEPRARGPGSGSTRSRWTAAWWCPGMSPLEPGAGRGPAARAT